MTSGRTRLLDAATALLAERPDQVPSTRELYEASGVAAPTLYHHFGTKEKLFDAVVEQTFDAYLDRKRALRRTGDLIVDLGAGWDAHVAFGVANPALYGLMYAPGRVSAAAETADRHLRDALERMYEAGVLRTDVDTAASMTTAAAIGCVTQLNRCHGSPTDPFARAIRTALITQLTGQPDTATTPARSARALLNHFPGSPDLFTPAESALLQQWLRVIATEPDRPT